MYISRSMWKMLTLLVLVATSTPTHGENVTVFSVRRHVLEPLKYCPEVYAAFLGGDTVMYCSAKGVFIQSHRGGGWKKANNVLSKDENTPNEVCAKRKNISRLVAPEGLWRIDKTSEIIVYDGFCSRLYSFHIREEGKGTFDRRLAEVDEYYPRVVTIQNETILYGLARFADTKAVFIQQADEDHYEKVFEYSPLLAHRLDSLGLGNGESFSFPAMNPYDSSLWIAVYGYDYIYITDKRGELRDSVQVRAPDFKTPPQIKSRIKSMAVSIDWMSQWTPIKSFHYVPPRYFFLQYHLGYDYPGGAKIPLYGTLVWDLKGNPVALEIDKRWQLAGVEPCGNLIFASYQPDSMRCVLELHMATIEQ